MLSQSSFDAVTRLFHDASGIRLAAGKRQLVEGRLRSLAGEQGATDVDSYVRRLLAERHPAEIVRVVDRLTTNETYFFREPGHFDWLERQLAQRRGHGVFRVWSAASSSGEEAYSVAMVLAERLGTEGWEVVGTDLSTAMVDSARRALYPLARAQQLSQQRLQRWCRKGLGDYAGTLLVAPELRRRVRFECANLMQPLPAELRLGSFDTIFLRNVLIYFDNDAKAAIVRRVLALLAPGGLLYTGQAESISQLGLPVRALAPAVYEAV